MKSLHLLLSFTLLTCWSCSSDGKQVKAFADHFYVGTYTDGSSEGIYKCALKQNGELLNLGLVAMAENPSYLAKSYNDEFLLAVNESDPGTISSFKVGKDSLSHISTRSSGGAHPCFITINQKGLVLSANYTGGNVGVHKMDNKGHLSMLIDVQKHQTNQTEEETGKAHAHSVWFNHHANNIVAVDLGANALFFSQFDEQTGRLISENQSHLDFPAGTGPRHLSIHPEKEWFYVVNELNSTVSLISKNEDEYMIVYEVSTLPEDFKGDSYCADIQLSPDGKFLYASNRGHNSIAIFSIEEDGKPVFIEYELVRGNWPRNFSLTPSGDYVLVANQHSNNIVSFKRNIDTGSLQYVDEIKLDKPVCILF